MGRSLPWGSVAVRVTAECCSAHADGSQGTSESNAFKASLHALKVLFRCLGPPTDLCLIHFDQTLKNYQATRLGTVLRHLCPK